MATPYDRFDDESGTFELADNLCRSLGRAIDRARQTHDIETLGRMLGYVYGDIADWLDALPATSDVVASAMLDAQGRALGTAMAESPWDARDAVGQVHRVITLCAEIADVLGSLADDALEDLDGYEAWVVACTVSDAMATLAGCVPPGSAYPRDMPDDYDPTSAECVRAATCRDDAPDMSTTCMFCHRAR